MSSNLCSLIQDNSQCITLNDAGQHSTRMRCYFHCQCSCFIDYFDVTVLGGAGIYAGDIPFWYNKQEDTYTEFLGNPTGNVFLAESRDHEFLLSHRGTGLHASHSSAESRKSNYNYIEKSSFSTTTHAQISASDPSDHLH